MIRNLIWWLFCILGIALFYIADHTLPFHLFHYIIVTDNTFISFIIITMFLITTLRAGIETHFKNSFSLDFYWFIEQEMLALGFLGTIIGLMETFSIFFFGHPTQADMMTHVAGGMGAALTPTCVGVLCSMHLRWQMLILDKEE